MSIPHDDDLRDLVCAHMQVTGAGAKDTVAHFEAQGILLKPATVRSWRMKHVDTDLLQASAVWVPVEDLVPWADNPRINEHAVEPLARSIWRFGFDQPIVATAPWCHLHEDQEGRVVGTPARLICKGHTRRRAVLHLVHNVPLLDEQGAITGWRTRTEEDEPYQVPGSPRPGLVPVVWREYADMDEFRAAALADNRTGEIAAWAEDQAIGIVAELVAAGRGEVFDMGWSADEIDELLADLDEEDDEPGAGSEAAPSGGGRDAGDSLPEEVPAITEAGEVVTLGRHTLHCASCIDVANAMDENSVDAIVGKAWDAGVPGREWADAMFRVLKPGGHLVMFCGTRTQHRMVCALEDAGFEVRDTIHWMHYQGFPKSLDISKAIDKAAGAERQVIGSGENYGKHTAEQGKAAFGDYAGSWDITAPATDDAKRWNGWGTALKPAIEPAILCRKPLDEPTVAANVLKWRTGGLNIDGCRIPAGDPAWPGPGGEVQAVANPSFQNDAFLGATVRDGTVSEAHPAGRFPANVYACPKPAVSEKGEANKHPTVKPIRLMRWITRLVTPPGGTVYNPFGGSGTDLLAAEAEGFTSIATELEPAYCDIIRARFQGTQATEE